MAAPAIAQFGRRDRKLGGVTVDPDKTERIVRRGAVDAPCPAQSPFDCTLAVMAGDPRSVMVFAAPADPERREQLDALAFDTVAAARRDVIVVDVAERLDALALCDHYRVPPGAFAVVLIGRSGAELQRWEGPVETGELWALIDGLDRD